jgi:signal transduction histidine kinase
VLAALRINKLQRKILLVIVVIILVPMLITGILSSSWIASRMDNSIARRLRDSVKLDADILADLHENAHLFAHILLDASSGRLVLRAGHSPIPRNLKLLAQQLGISLVQVYDARAKLLYSSQPAKLALSWALPQDSAVVKVTRGKRDLLAAITLVPLPADHMQGYHLVLGTLFDKALLTRLSRDSGLMTRLYYAHNGDFANAFSADDTPLKLNLPAAAFAKLVNKQDYFSPQAEHGRYWGLYSPVVDASGHVEAVLFSGQARVGSARLLTEQAWLAIAIMLFGTLLAIGTGLLLSRFVVRPVAYLHKGVMRLAAQDFRASIPIDSQDELGELAQAFNTMARSLREARDQQQREFRRDKLSALGELSLAMAHEIRNPIGIINTASRLLETTADKNKQSELHCAIREESLRLDRLLNDFQHLARHHRPQFVAINPAAPLEKALQVMLAGQDNITILRRFQHGTMMVQADADLLYQAWVNLIRNALDAMGPQGGRLEAGSVMEANAVLLYLHDNGPGIPLEQMTRLFEPFYTTKEQGSGLGLTIANTLAEANGAHLELVPGRWRGARFAMRFSITPAESN